MAFRSYLRLGYAMCAIVGTLCTTAPTYASSDQTITTGDIGYGNVFVIGYVDTFQGLDIAPLALFKQQPPACTVRGYHVTKPIAIKERASGAAVRPSSLAGWRSGRTRHLAA